jgi:hypothetical protein
MDQWELDFDHLMRLDCCRRLLEPIEFFEQERDEERTLLNEIRERLIRLADLKHERARRNVQGDDGPGGSETPPGF